MLTFMSSEIAGTTSPADKTEQPNMIIPGSKPDTRKRKETQHFETEHFQHELKKAMRVFKKAEDECDEKEKIFRAAEDAYFRADDDWKAASDLKLKLRADAFMDKKNGGCLPPELTNRLWQEVESEYEV